MGQPARHAAAIRGGAEHPDGLAEKKRPQPLSETLVAAAPDDVLERDEMWTFVGSKACVVWLWLALCRRTRQVVADHLGDRSDAACTEFRARLPPGYADLPTFSDRWAADAAVFDPDTHQSCAKQQHFFAAFNLMCLLASLEDESNPTVKSTAIHADEIVRWYPHACIEAFEHFGLDPLSVHQSMTKRMHFAPPPISVEILEEGGIYTAICETLGIVTEATTTDELINQVYELVPDMVELNRPDLASELVRLSFEFAPPADARRRAG